MLKFIKAFILSFLLFLSHESSTQQLLFNSYSVADGLCSNTVWSIAQDQQGFMWFGTRGGLNRFDGYEFKSFIELKNDSTALGNNFVRHIEPLKDGNLLIGTENGVYLFDIDTEQFTHIIPEIQSGIHDIHIDQSDNIWIGTSEDGMVVLKNTNGRFNVIYHLLSGTHVRAITESRDGTFWVGTFGAGLYQFNKDGEEIRVFHEGGIEGLNTNSILSLFNSLEGKIWVGTLSGGLLAYDASQDHFVSYMADENQNSISDNIVRAIAQREKGKILIGTEKGLDILNTTTGTFEFNRTSNDPHSLSDNAVWTLYIDNSKDIWLGTYFGGVNHVNLHNGKFEYYYPSGVEKSLRGKAVSSFFQDANGVWVGTEDGGLNFWDLKENAFYQYPFQKRQGKLSYHNIHTLLKSKNDLYVGTFSGGLNVINLVSGQVTVYTKVDRGNNSLSSNNIYKIFEDSGGNIWIGTTSGLNKLSKESGAIQELYSSLFHDCVIYDILEDNQNKMWVATYGAGLFSKEKNGQWKSSHEGIRFISLFTDRKGRIWAGTEGSGLFLIEDDTIAPFEHEKDIAYRTVYGGLEDRKGNLWLSTNQGIHCLNAESGRNISFSDWGHIQGKQFNYGAFFEDDEGEFYFGGTNGFNVFQPDTVLKYYEQSDYKLHLTKLELFNQTIDVKSHSDILPSAINYIDDLTLNHSQSVISFSYAGLDFVAPKSIQYAYKMEGFEKDWNEVGAIRRATYTNLGPGKYTFMVRAFHSGDSRSMKYARLNLTILPPFYQTTNAYVIYVLVIIGSIIFLRHRTLARIEQKNQIKLTKMKQKEEELFYKRKIEFFTEMAHEIRTPLSLIIAPLEKLLESKNTDTETLLELSVMAKNSDRLLSLINQLLDFRRVESEGYRLRKEKVDLINLVRVIYEGFAGRADQNNVKISFTTEISHKQVEVDVDAFNKILSNLLSNALKFARSKVSIGINVDDESGFFTVIVKDDGIGIPKEDIDHIFDRFFKVKSGDFQYNNLGGTGIGLSLAKSLVEMHEGTLSVSSKEMRETQFQVRLPIISVEEHEEASPGLMANPEDNQAPKLLIAEDDIELSRFLINAFRENGFIVFPASNGQEALQILEAEEIDLVLSDVMMPFMDGVELCRAIRNDISLCQVPVVILTAKSDAEAKMEALSVGADSYFTKPFKFNHIHQTLINFLKSRMQLKLKFSSQPFQDASSITYTSKDEEFVNKIVALIHANISNNKYSTEVLSHEVGISRSGLHKKLKSISGISPNEFIRLIRLKFAAQLLQTGNHNISEVGYLSGFSSPSYFTKCFHEQFDKTPKEFVNETAQTEG